MTIYGNSQADPWGGGYQTGRIGVTCNGTTWQSSNTNVYAGTYNYDADCCAVSGTTAGYYGGPPGCCYGDSDEDGYCD